MFGEWKLARIAGIDLRVHYSWLIILGLLAWSLAVGTFPQSFPNWAPETYWAVAGLASLLLLVSILLHELSHALVARAYGLRVHDITLFLFGGATHTEGEASRPRVEFWVALVGPLTSLALAGLCFGPMLAVGALQISLPLYALLGYLAWVNLALALFNLLPAFPLDGGRLLRATLWAIRGDQGWATRMAARAGVLFGYLLVLGTSV